MRIGQYLIAGMFLTAASVSSAEIRRFDFATFNHLQATGASAILFVHARWCPICRAQASNIATLLAKSAFRKITVLTIDYDTEKPLWAKFGVQRQSTLIAFHGTRETGRLLYDSDPAKLAMLLTSALR